MVPGGCQMMPGGRQMLPGGCQMLLDVARCCRKVSRGAGTLIFFDLSRIPGSAGAECLAGCGGLGGRDPASYRKNAIMDACSPGSWRHGSLQAGGMDHYSPGCCRLGLEAGGCRLEAGGCRKG